MSKNREFLIELLENDNVVVQIEKEIEHLLLIIPELNSIIGFEHCHPHHHLNVWEHTLLALSYSKNQFKTRLSLLLHDIGKPFSYQRDGEIMHYRGHAEQSAIIAKSILERLGFDKNFINEVIEIIKVHDTPLSELFISAHPLLAKDIFEVQKCDVLAHNPEHNQKRLLYINKIGSILK